MPKLPVQLLDLQCGVISRAQCLEHGLSPAEIEHALSSGRWRRVLAGIYQAHTGDVCDEGRAWAAVLHAGEGAAINEWAAIALADRRRRVPARIDVVIREDRRVDPQPGLRVLRSMRPIQQVGAPARTQPQRAALDILTRTRDASSAIAVVTDVVGARLCTAAELRAELAKRRRQRHRPLILDLLADVAMGAQSPLELQDLRNDRAHGLPVAGRQIRVRDPRLGPIWIDAVVARQVCLVKELDGRLGHEGQGRFRDMMRDNSATLSGASHIRLGHLDLFGDPCETAALQMLFWARQGDPVGGDCTNANCDSAGRMQRLAREFPRWETAA